MALHFTLEFDDIEVFDLNHFKELFGHLLWPGALVLKLVLVTDEASGLFGEDFLKFS